MENPFQDFSGSLRFDLLEYNPEVIPPATSIVINMTMLDEIDAWASPFKEIILNVDGKMHRYKTEEVLKILKEIELD